METITIDYKETFLKFLDDYSKDENPIQVNFKELVNSIKFQDRATHSIHTYPAKLLPNIPYFFINNSYFVDENDLVLDPFSGSGTVLLEAILGGKNAYGCDANPLARLISKVKTNSFDTTILKSILESLKTDLKNNTLDKDIKYPDVVNIDYWFLPNIKLQLNNILITIKGIDNEKYRDFFLLCFSNCVKKVSLADSRISVPVKAKTTKISSHPFFQETKSKLEKLESKDVYEKFFEIITDNIRRFETKENLQFSDVSAKLISNDAREFPIENETVDLIITSPPYAGAQKYIRASSLNLGWTELSTKENLRALDKKNIGRENYSKSEYLILKETNIKEADILLNEIYKSNPLRAHIAANYLIEMRQAIKESIRVLKKDKYLILVAANNKVCDKEFKTQEYLRQIAEEEGMLVICRLIDDIKSYGLMTKRNKTASVITSEWVLILKKYDK